MALSILNNIPSLAAQNQLAITGSNLQRTLFRLSSGSRINSGADDAAGLAIADGLRANITALTQSSRNANDGVGMLQVADGSLAQATTLLNRAVTLATESATGTVSDTQRGALDAEFQSILDEIDRIGTNTTFNGTAVFSGTAIDIYLSDSTTTGSSTISVTTGALAKTDIGDGTTALDMSGDDLTSASNAQAALDDINAAIANIATRRGNLGATMNRLQSAVNVINNQTQNLSAAEDGIRAADIAQEVANMTKYSILSQTGISSLAQANQMQQSVLSLLK
jgi:flagellin